MKTYTADSINNICLVSHGGVGKTMLLEAMTFTTQGSTRLGRTDQGSSMYDTRADEIERRMTIGLKTSFVEWNKRKINVLDTPGFIEFLGEAKSALRVVESAVVLIDAMDGIQVGTEQVSKYIDEAGVPRLFFVNKMDKENANFDGVLKMLVEAYGTGVAPIQIPMGQSASFNGIIDLITMEAYTYGSGNGIGTKEPIPDALKARAGELRAKLMEAVAESDEALMTKFFEAGELSNDELLKGLLAGISSGSIFPVLCGSAVNNVGTDLLLNTICNLCPAANSRKEAKVLLDNGSESTIPLGPDQPLAAFVYKTIADEHMGMITFLRVFSGSLKAGDEEQNTVTNTSERMSAMYAMRGTSRNDLASVSAGDLCATLKLRNTHTGNTLTAKVRAVKFPPISFPSPLVEKAIYPKSKGDEEKISIGMARLHEEDPIFIYRYDPDIKQTVIAGMGDVHIDVLLSSLQKRYNVVTELKLPRVPYRETIKGRGDAKYRHKKQSGGAGQFAEVWMRIEPKAAGEGIEFTESLVGQNVDRGFVPSVEKGVMGAVTEGVLAGFRIVDVKIDFYDGKMHPVDSNDMAFQIAGRSAFKEAFLSARPVLLEPIYDIEVTVPEEYTGDIMGDLSSRRGKIGGMDLHGKLQTITGKVPLVELGTYMQTLRSITQGRGVYTRKLSHYEEVPGELANKLLENLKKQKEAEQAKG